MKTISMEKWSHLDLNRVGGKTGEGVAGRKCLFSHFPKLVFLAKKSLNSTLVLAFFLKYLLALK